MYQYDDATAVAALPAPAAAGLAGYFTDGNPVAGQPATILRADFMNMLMMELINLVTTAGIAPSKIAYNQVLQAIQTIASPGSLFGANGYVQLPKGIGVLSGLIIQWGLPALPNIVAGSTNTVALPVSFPTQCYVCVASLLAAGSTGYSMALGTFFTQGVPISSININVGSSAIEAATGASFIAIGR